MIVVRNVFQLQFGKARDALALWKEASGLAKKVDPNYTGFRLLTDVTGPAYTLVVEFTYPSLAEFEKTVHSLMSSPEWKAWYQKFIPLARSSHREIFTVIE